MRTEILPPLNRHARTPRSPAHGPPGMPGASLHARLQAPPGVKRPARYRCWGSALGCRSPRVCTPANARRALHSERGTDLRDDKSERMRPWRPRPPRKGAANASEERGRLVPLRRTWLRLHGVGGAPGAGFAARQRGPRQKHGTHADSPGRSIAPPRQRGARERQGTPRAHARKAPRRAPRRAPRVRAATCRTCQRNVPEGQDGRGGPGRRHGREAHECHHACGDGRHSPRRAYVCSVQMHSVRPPLCVCSKKGEGGHGLSHGLEAGTCVISAVPGFGSRAA